MALAKELMGSGFSAGQASAVGGYYSAVTATGSVQGDAAAIGAGMTVVSGADATKGVILTGQPGDSVWVFNSSASALKVYPTSGAAICVPGTGLGSANAAYSMTLQSLAEFKCITSTQWFVNKSA